MVDVPRHAAQPSDDPDRQVEATPEGLERALLGRPASMGRREVSRGAQVSVRSARKFWHALGFPLVQEGEPMFTEADLEALKRVATMVREEIVDEEFALGMTRAIARTMNRLAVWQTQLMSDAVAEQAGETYDIGADLGRINSPEVAQASALAIARLTDELEPLMIYVWRRQLTAAINRMLADATPERDTTGVPRAVGFADLVNFTSLVQRMNERELATMVERFEVLATDIVTAHGGRVVKTVGDEVMFLTIEAAPAAAIGLDLVEAMAEDDLVPDARVGMAYGSVINRLGDVFGTTVNRASRLTAAAPPGGVLVDDAMAKLVAPVSGFSTRPARRRTLRGLGSVTPSRLLRVTGVRGRVDVTAHP